MFSIFKIFKKKKIIPHIRLSGIIGSVGRFRQGINFAGQQEIIDKASRINLNKKETLIYNDPQKAVKNSNVIYTDVWASMGQEEDAVAKEKLFKGFTVDTHLLDKAKSDCIVLHCLPAYRGKEISEEIIESKFSRVFVQSENRLHVQQALLIALMS